MPDENTVRIVVHRQNIARYRSLLRTPLTAIERDFIDRRIEEEEAEIHRLMAESNWHTATGTRSGTRQVSGSDMFATEPTTGC